MLPQYMKHFLIIGFSSLWTGFRFQGLLWLIPFSLCLLGGTEQPVPRCSHIKACAGQLMFEHPNPQPSFFPNFNGCRCCHFPSPTTACVMFCTQTRRGQESFVRPSKGASRSPLDDKTLHWPLALKTVTIEWSKGLSTRACSRKKERNREKKTLSPTRRMNINTCKDGSRGKTDGPYEHSPFFSRSVREGKGRFPLLSVWLSLLTFVNEWKIR